MSGAPASTTHYYLSTTKTYNGEPPLTSRAIPALGAGEQSAASTQVTLPAGVGGGTFYLLVIADGNEEISEPLETNNLKYLTVVIP